MQATVLCIGDPHIQVSNISETDLLIERLINLATKKKPDLIIVLGDVLHTHERLHTIALNKAYELINNMRLISKTYVLVGNHDMINNQVFLNENHIKVLDDEFERVNCYIEYGGFPLTPSLFKCPYYYGLWRNIKNINKYE